MRHPVGGTLTKGMHDRACWGLEDVQKKRALLTAELTAEGAAFGVTLRYGTGQVEPETCVSDEPWATERYTASRGRRSPTALHTRGVAGSNPVPPTIFDMDPAAKAGSAVILPLARARS